MDLHNISFVIIWLYKLQSANSASRWITRLQGRVILAPRRQNPMLSAIIAATASRGARKKSEPNILTQRLTPHVVVVGGGFGRLVDNFRALRNALGANNLFLVDRCNHHLFQPLLYQVATGGTLGHRHCRDLCAIFTCASEANVDVRLAEQVERVEPAARRVLLKGGETLSYDMLVLAAGARHAYFGNEHWAEFAPGLKTLDDALRLHLRRRLLLAFERAEAETDETRHELRSWLSFAIIGGGPTGVELAGTLAEIARHTLRREFRHIDPAAAKVRLVEAGPRVLGSFPERLSSKARKQLENLGVEVITGAQVTGISGDGYRIGDNFVRAHTVVWAAGVSASPLGTVARCEPGSRRTRAGAGGPERARSPGDFRCRRPGDRGLRTGKLRCRASARLLAPKQMGNHVAQVIRDRLAGKAASAFRYRDYGNLATIRPPWRQSSMCADSNSQAPLPGGSGCARTCSS